MAQTTTSIRVFPAQKKNDGNNQRSFRFTSKENHQHFDRQFVKISETFFYAMDKNKRKEK